MAKTDGDEAISESPELEFTIAPDELALLEGDFDTEEESATTNIKEKIENNITYESTGHKSSLKDALLNVPTTTSSKKVEVAKNAPSQKKTYVPITFEPFTHTDESENTSLQVNSGCYASKEPLRPPGEDCEVVQAVSVPDLMKPQSVAKPEDKIPAELFPPGETSDAKSSCLEKLSPIALVTPAATRNTQAPVVNNYVVPTGFQPPPVNNFMQYHGPTPMDYTSHFTPFGTFSESHFLPQPPVYCPAPMFPEPMLMCAVPEPVPPTQPYNTGPYGPSGYSNLFSATSQLNSFVSAVNAPIIPSIQPPTIPPPTMLSPCPPPVSMVNRRPPPISMPSLSTASLAVCTNSLPYAVSSAVASLETASQKAAVDIKEKENESRFFVSFSNIYRFIRHAEFRKLVSVCGPLKYFKYQPPVVGGDALGSAEACFTNRLSALRAKRLLSALTIGGAQVTASTPTSLVDTNEFSDPEKTKDVECMVAITNLLQGASRVFNWDNNQHWQKSTLAISVKPENRPFPENKPVLQKKDATSGGRNNLITIRLGSNIQAQLNTPPPAIVTQMPSVTTITMTDSSTLSPNAFPPLSIAAWVHSLNSPQPSKPPKPVPAPLFPYQNSLSCNLSQQSSSNSSPPLQNIVSKRSDDKTGGDKPSNKTILASIEAINKQIRERKERINKQLEKVYSETSHIKERNEYCVRVEGLNRLAVEDLQRSCNATQHFIGTEAMFLLPDSDRAYLLQHLLHRHRLLDARVRAELLNCKVFGVNNTPRLKANYMMYVQQALTLHEATARKSLVDDLDQVIDVYKYKMKKCYTPRCSDSGCQYFHNASDYRRDPLVFCYRPEFCPDRPQCKESVRCRMCHTETELRVHTKIFPSEVCRDWVDDGTGCPHRPGSCFKAHPKSPEMLFHPEWRDLYVKGLRNTFLFLAGAVRSMHRVDSTTAGNVRVLAVFPCEALVKSALELLGPTAQRHLVRMAAVTDKEADHHEASVLLGTVSTIVSLVRHGGCASFSDLRVFIVDDLPSIIEEPKMLDDFVCFISLLYTTLAKSGCQQSLQRVVVAQEVTDEEVAAARTLLSTNFLLATNSYALKPIHSKPLNDVVSVTKPSSVDHSQHNEGTGQQETEKYVRDEFQQSNGSEKFKDNARRRSGEEKTKSAAKSNQQVCNDVSNYEHRQETKNAFMHGQQESVRNNESKIDSRERSGDRLRKYDEVEHSKDTTHQHQVIHHFRDVGRRTDSNESYRDQTYRQEEMKDRVRSDSRSSPAEKATRHILEDRSSKVDDHRHGQETSIGKQSERRDRKLSSPESDASSTISSDRIDSNSGNKRKTEELSTERKTWRIKLSSVTVNPAKKRKEGNAGVLAEATKANFSSERSDGNQIANSKYLEDEKTLRKDHDEEYEVFKDMPEMHPEYEEVMEEFTKLYPAGDEDRRWKMYWNIKLETIREKAWEEKRKDLIEKHKTATQQRNKPRLSSNSQQSSFDRYDDSRMVNSENFSVTDAYDSLDDQTDEMGVLGPPLRRLLRQARNAGFDTVEALTLFTNPDNATLVRMCVDKLRKLLPTAPQSKVLVMRRTAVLAEWLLPYAKKAFGKYEEIRRNLLDLDLIAVAKATLGRSPSEIMNYIKSNLGSECNKYISKEEFNEVIISISSMHLKMVQECKDFLNTQPSTMPSAPSTSEHGPIKESEIPMCFPATSSKRPPTQPHIRHPKHKVSTDPWFVGEVRAIMAKPGVSVEIFNRSLCDIFSRKPAGYTFTKKDLSLANDLKQLTGFNLTESMFLFALKKILSELDEQ